MPFQRLVSDRENGHVMAHEHFRRLDDLTYSHLVPFVKRWRAGQKDRALVTLRQRKYQESLLQKTDVQLENLEQLVRHISVLHLSHSDHCVGH